MGHSRAARSDPVYNRTACTLKSRAPQQINRPPDLKSDFVNLWERSLDTTIHEQQLAFLEVFANPRPERDYQILHTCHEFTSLCPKTGQPDFATIVVDYTPDELCLELKALKLYLQGFRQQGIFYEAVINQILDDLVAACTPRRMKVVGNFSVRGGLSSIVTAEFRQTPGPATANL